jgi:hypothetical protein
MNFQSTRDCSNLNQPDIYKKFIKLNISDCVNVARIYNDNLLFNLKFTFDLI